MFHVDGCAWQSSEASSAAKVSFEGPDPFAIGQEKLAEFWPVYVREADAYDKELSEGWNKFSAATSFCWIIVLTVLIVYLQYARSDTE